MTILRRETARRLVDVAQQVESRRQLQPHRIAVPKGGDISLWFYGVVGKVVHETGRYRAKVHRLDVRQWGGPFPECDEDGWVAAKIMQRSGAPVYLGDWGDPLPGCEILCCWNTIEHAWCIMQVWPPIGIYLDEPLRQGGNARGRVVASYFKSLSEGIQTQEYGVRIFDAGGLVPQSQYCRWSDKDGWHIPVYADNIRTEICSHWVYRPDEPILYFCGSGASRAVWTQTRIAWRDGDQGLQIDGKPLEHPVLPRLYEWLPFKTTWDNPWRPTRIQAEHVPVFYDPLYHEIIVPCQQGGVPYQSIDTGRVSLQVFEGHIVEIGPGEQPGPIRVGGNISPSEAAGQFFPWPGLWNGMPQWRRGQNPNWWLRWVPWPNNPQQGRWVIGQWPNDAQPGQQPQRGWGHRPPVAGQPPNQNPIDEFPEQIGDVEGAPQAITADYLIQDCADFQNYVELVNSGQFAWPVNQVIKWADAQGNVHCGKVADMPIEGTKVQQWRLISLEKNCQVCGVDVVVADCDRPQRKYRLQGSGNLGLQPGQVVVWVENPGGGVWEQLHCGTVLAESDLWTREVSPGAWAFGKIISSCQQCPSGQCPSYPSCPSYPNNPSCPEYCPCIEVIGQIQPADALGIYTLEGIWNEHCCWKKDNWAIYYIPSVTKWYIQNLQAPAQQYWRRHGNVWGAYLPRDAGETQGVAIVIGR